MLPEPEFPDDWHLDEPASPAYMAAPATPLDDMLTLERLEPEIESSSNLAIRPSTKPVKDQPSAVSAVAEGIPAPQDEPEIHIPPIAPPPLPEPAPDDGLPPRLITVFLRPTGDADRDRRRIKYVYGILISYPGKDRFQFQIFENGKGHLIDFPNDSTRIAPEMLTRLRKLMGEESWRVEEITYQ
jgi:DNA polymerase-3 subunit alpha